MIEFDDYENTTAADDSKPLNNKELFRTSLEEQSRRLSNVINSMKNKNTEVKFKLDPSIVADVRRMAEFAGISLSAMSRQLLTEYLTSE